MDNIPILNQGVVITNSTPWACLPRDLVCVPRGQILGGKPLGRMGEGQTGVYNGFYSTPRITNFGIFDFSGTP